MTAPVSAETPTLATAALTWLRERHDANVRAHEHGMNDAPYRAAYFRKRRAANRRFAALVRRAMKKIGVKTTRNRDRCERPARRRRRVAVRSSARSGDSGDEPGEPAWPRRVCARLSLKFADAAGHEALISAMAGERGWSA